MRRFGRDIRSLETLAQTLQDEELKLTHHSLLQDFQLRRSLERPRRLQSRCWPGNRKIRKRGL